MTAAINRYFLMRHGRSKANDEGIIISDPKTGIEGWGLTSDSGKTIQEAIRASGLAGDTIVFTSPFLRAIQTASLVSGILGLEKPIVDNDLRERYFGSFDGERDTTYKRVWEQDRISIHNDIGGVESPALVLKRMLAVIARIDNRFSGSTVLLVSHGDPLNILLCHLSGKDVSMHREIPSMNTAEIRLLTETPHSQPSSGGHCPKPDAFSDSNRTI